MAAKPWLTPQLRAENDRDAIVCHSLRHSWDFIGAGDRVPEFGSLMCLRCVRCGTLRYDRFSRLTGQRIGRPQYVYPDFYRDTEGHDPDWWRQAMAEIIYGEGLLAEPEVVVPLRRRKSAS